MIDQNNNINDKHIRDLLKWRLLEQIEDDDLLTQKLMDMEAKLVFSNEALLVPSLQKENELFKKLNRKTQNNKFYKWLFPLILLILSVPVFFIYNHSAIRPAVVQQNGKKNLTGQPFVMSESSKPNDQNNQTTTEKQIFSIKKSDSSDIALDTNRSNIPEKWLVGDPGIKVDYKPEEKKYDTYFANAYDHIPALNPKQIEANNKLKEKMIKQIIKRDRKGKEYWVYIPMSSDIFKGDVVSIQAFYMSTTEVTNGQYRVFLNDLIIHDKTDDYIKAVPDTTKWIIDPKKNYEPMVNMYFWHPAYNDFPVVNISRAAAKMYCDWLTNAVNEKIKEDYPQEKWSGLFINDLRIPSELEWVEAARGGLVAEPDYPWGPNPDKKSPLINGIQNGHGCYLCNFSIINYPDSLKKKSECANVKLKGAITSAGSISGDFYFTAKVNSYNPNYYGLYCMSGNVAEMAWKNLTNAPITKGGSWNSDADHVKINEIENEGITGASPFIGFRPVFTVAK